MKRYIFTVPQQPADKLRLTQYSNPTGSSLLRCDKPTRFPIISAVSGTAEKGEKISIIAVKPRHKNCEINFTEFFLPEIDEAKNETSFEYDITVIDTPFSEFSSDQLKLFIDIAALFGSDDRIYADLTFGTKPMPMVMLMAMTYANRFNRNISVEAVIYGLFNHEKKTGAIYELSSLFYMNSLVNTLSTDTPDPESIIRGMLDF